MSNGCQRCDSKRLVEVNGKTSDLCSVYLGDKEHDGYVPEDMGIGGGDYLDFTVCLDCGQLQGEFPLPPTELESEDENDCFVDDEEDDY